MIPKDWEIKELKEIAPYINEKISLDEIDIKSFISTENMLPDKNGITIASSLPKVGKVTQFKEGDILFSNIRTYFKKLWLAKFSGGCSNDVLVIRGKYSINNKYLYYFLSQNKFFEFTVLTSKGTKMPRGDKNAIMGYNINIPSIHEQSAIAKILSDLDSKIELNQQMNKTLEAIGQAIFKHRFVDFEFPNEEGKPYKSSGGEMVDSELGVIPKGWNVKNVQDLLVFEKGVEPGSKFYMTEDSQKNIRFIRVGDINTPGRENTFIPIELAGEKFCRENDILLSLDATIGIVRIGMNGAFSSGIRKVYSREKGDVPKAYIYSLLTSKYIQDTIYTYAIGTTILHAGASLDHMDLPIPNVEILKKFSNVTEPIFNSMVNNIIENNNLSQIRDSLLPKLMSGKIRVN